MVKTLNLTLCIVLCACAERQGVRKPLTNLSCDELSPTLESPLVERGARVALRPDGSLLVQVGLSATRNVGGQSVRRFEAFRMLSLGDDGALQQVKPTPSALTPSFAVAPDYEVVATAMHCEKQYYGFKYDQKGNEKLRFLIGPYNAIKEMAVGPLGHTYVLATSQSGRASDITLDDAGIRIVKNVYDTSFVDVLLAFDAQGNELWRRNITELDGLGGSFGLVVDKDHDALFVIAARDAARSPDANVDTVVARYDVGVGLGQGQFVVPHNVDWGGLRMGRDGLLVAFGDALSMPPALESRDVVVARVHPEGAVTELRFGSEKADHVFDAGADGAGGVYVVGSVGGKLVQFGGDETIVSGFAMKYASGAVVWSRAFTDPAAGITLTTIDVSSEGVVAAAGLTTASLNGSVFEGGTDSVVFKLDTNGETIATNLQCACGD